MLSSHGVNRFLVNGSGDVFYQNADPRKILKTGLEHPDDFSKVIGVVDFAGGAMCSSAGNRRKWGNYHHLIDPDTLSSPKEIIASWVIADSAALADGIATALFFSEPEKIRAEMKFEYLILNKDYKVKRSRGFRATLY